MKSLCAPPKPDAQYIRSMFNGMAARYDRFSALIGLGQSHRLRRTALQDLRTGDRVLDIGCGTGDLALAAARLTGPQGYVLGLDFSPSMLEVARHRARTIPHSNHAPLDWICRGAETLPVDSQNAFDWVVSGFVLRNLYENIDRILSGVYASLKNGGRISFLDLAEPESRFLRLIYRAYLFIGVGLYGLALFGPKYPIPYLPDSSRRFIKPNEFAHKLAQIGFKNILTRRFMLGSVVLYQAQK